MHYFACGVFKARNRSYKAVIFLSGNTKRGKYHCTVDLLFDWLGLVCFANKNKNCQLSSSWFQTSQTGGQRYSDTSPFSIPYFYGYKVRGNSENVKFHKWQIHCCLKWVCQSLSLIYFNFANLFILANIFLGGWKCRKAGQACCTGRRVLPVLAPSSQTVGSLLRTAPARQVGQKNSAESEFVNFTSMGGVPFHSAYSFEN